VERNASKGKEKKLEHIYTYVRYVR